MSNAGPMCHQHPDVPAIVLQPLDDKASVPLCLDCYFKYSQITQQQLENLEREANYAVQQMEAVTGIRGVGPMYPPRPKPTYFSGVKMNNISLKNSVVGTINSGAIGTVNQSISVFKQLGASNLAEAVKGLSEAVLESADLTRNQQNELIEIVSEIVKQASVPKEARDPSTTSWVERAVAMTASATDIAERCAKYWPVIAGVFQAAT